MPGLMETLKKRLVAAAALAVVAPLVFICGRNAFAEPCIDGDAALSHVRALVEMGPRPPGSGAAQKAQDYILNELARRGVEVREQNFEAQTPLGPIGMKNIIGVIPGRSDDILIIGTHYDTKLTASFPFVGANDGGSGTGVLLEMARCLKTRENIMTVWLVFFDGEEALVKWSRADGLYGSRHLVDTLVMSGGIAKVKAMLLLDMVGDKHLSIEWETRSTSWLKEIIWAAANELGHEEQFTKNPRRIADDHVPFLERDIPAVDLIDFRYGPDSRSNEYWHSPNDTLDKIGPASLKIVGDVVLESLPGIAGWVNGEPSGSAAVR